MGIALQSIQNRLLTALSDEDRQRWLPNLELVELPLGEVLYEPDTPLSYVYFPTTAVISLRQVMEEGAPAEIAVVGNEGIIGVPVFMGGESTPSRAVVQNAGHALRMTAGILKGEIDSHGPVLQLLLRYTQALMTELAHTVLCNRHHSVDQKLCRRLLLRLDRLPGNDLVLTQELLSSILGVRRESVNEAALKLQQAGLIRYARGRITVIDRPGLERITCECYAVVKKEYERLLAAESMLSFSF